MKLDQTVDIGTDIASFFLFHPDDLVHRNDDPMDWHAYDFACRKEFEAGNLVAFRTGGDGGYQLRLTSGDLTGAERALETGSWEWGYTVRHGKILVDNGDFLPSEQARGIEKVSDGLWVTIPNGDYRVVVHPIERDDDSLPDYVVRFEPVGKPLHLAAAPPELLPLRDSPPVASSGATANDVFKEKADGPLEKTYPLIVQPGRYVLPGGSLSMSAPDELYEAVVADDPSLLNADKDIYVVCAPSDGVPETGTVSWINSASQMRGEPGRIVMRGQRLVRITKRTEGKLLPVAQVEPITRSKSPLSEKNFRELQTAFDRYAEKHTKGKEKIASFERERVAAITEGNALTTRLIELVPMPVETRFQLQAASDTERAKELVTILDAA